MKTIKFLIIILIFNISYTNVIYSLTAKSKTVKSRTLNNSKVKFNKKNINRQKTKKNQKISKRKKSRSYKMSSSAKILGNFLSFTKTDTLISPGIRYKNILFGKRRTKISANILEIDISNKNNKIEVLKAKNNINELDKLQQIIKFRDSIDNNYTLAAVNSSFWRAVRNNPIGPCIVDGNVVELNPYKEWTTFFIDENGYPYIDNFKLKGSVKFYDGKTLMLSSTNRRKDSTGIILYNIYGGNTIPHINSSKLDKLVSKVYSEILADSVTFNGDSTEISLSIEDIQNNILEQERSEQLESSIYKALVEFIDKPAINKPFRAIVNYIDTGAVKINKNQGILSLGYYLPPDIGVLLGDTLVFSFETNIHSDKHFTFACSATPRLVRHGTANHEAYFEGSRSRRFINGQLGRTSIGYNASKSKFFMVTIDHPNSSAGKKGASLGELAQIMKQIGCYDAMNLDGGGSSIMVIDGKNIMAKNNPDASRRISVGIGIRKSK